MSGGQFAHNKETRKGKSLSLEIPQIQFTFLRHVVSTSIAQFAAAIWWNG